ncbi:molybdopterin-dependent oxidoreductase [Nocardioides sp. HDW12B]|uniref:molybdopterin-dependent oxidoreductase n=1 Tax=Nocardioides sp. HDW12B TaxID=2714939 RepID=UPI0014099695|nr:molybdopterin-dependent oxidoreductase [Nocardioides sp. HDW12B]QIK66116.1 molybdopterin-dependent oxidoreductase [Nocardioides sp. HDW12B]
MTLLDPVRRAAARRPPAPAEEDFTSRLRSPAVAARIGLWLGVTFTVAFLTGIVSHWAQSPTPWLSFPSRPAWGYRVTQGLHVVSGTAAIPLLLVKLWTVYPRLFASFGRGARQLLVSALERASIAVLVASAVFQLSTGLMNSAQWYPWAFSFRSTHFAVAWVAIGALVVHVAVKLPVIRAALTGHVDDEGQDRAGTDADGALSRRGLLRSTWVASGVAVLASAGSTVPLLREVSVLGVRSGDGPQGLPVNKSARAAGVTSSALSPSYALELVRGGTTVRLTREQLLAMPQVTEELPIACVEGWSASGTWTGVRVKDLLAEVGAEPGDVVVTSLQTSGPYTTTLLPANFVADDATLLALQLDGEDLSIDHGYPARVIAPNRPGVLQTKWVGRLEVEA